MKTASEIALEHLREKTILPTRLTSTELEKLDVNVRRKNFFSAQVYQGEILSRAQQLTSEIVEGKLDGATARALMKSELARLNYEAVPGEEGTIKDLRSDRRLNLIRDTNVDMARGYGQWMAGQTEDALAMFPAQELVRVGPMPTVPRKWRQRWLSAGGKFLKGRMMAHKQDGIWSRISRFGNPYPPFDYLSGMRLQDVDAEETGDMPAPENAETASDAETYGGDATAGAAGLSVEFRAAMKRHFGDLVQFSADGKVVKNDVELVEKMWEAAQAVVLGGGVTAKKKMKAIQLGEASGNIVAFAGTAGFEIEGFKLVLDFDSVVHIIRRHGDETIQSQRSVTLADLIFVILQWRNAKDVQLEKKRSLRFLLEKDGMIYTFLTQRLAADKVLRFGTMYIKKASEG